MITNNPQRDSVPDPITEAHIPNIPKIPLLGENKMVERPKCMKAADCAKWLGVAKITWVRSNIAGKTPRGLRLGRLVLWDRAELERWLEAGLPARVVWDAENKRTKKEQRS